uniref:Uncharacterized protein n=1 Tax=Opuntia streptacantha TaxID=393608 RepID=A0A7C9EQZ1_OPUST
MSREKHMMSEARHQEPLLANGSPRYDLQASSQPDMPHSLSPEGLPHKQQPQLLLTAHMVRMRMHGNYERHIDPPDDGPTHMFVLLTSKEIALFALSNHTSDIHLRLEIVPRNLLPYHTYLRHLHE